MRTTLTIDDDVLVVAKAMADQQNKSLGEVISEPLRRALHRLLPPGRERSNGIPLLSPRLLETVNALRD